MCRRMGILLTIKKQQCKIKDMKKNIDNALFNNKGNAGSSHAAGRLKVIATQLNSNKRNELSCMQGIDYSYSSLFADIEPILLPEVLSLVGENHGQNELFRMLIATAPDLISAGAGRAASAASHGKRSGGNTKRRREEKG